MIITLCTDQAIEQNIYLDFQMTILQYSLATIIKIFNKFRVTKLGLTKTLSYKLPGSNKVFPLVEKKWAKERACVHCSSLKSFGTESFGTGIPETNTVGTEPYSPFSLAARNKNS